MLLIICCCLKKNTVNTYTHIHRNIWFCKTNDLVWLFSVWKNDKPALVLCSTWVQSPSKVICVNEVNFLWNLVQASHIYYHYCSKLIVHETIKRWEWAFSCLPMTILPPGNNIVGLQTRQPLYFNSWWNKKVAGINVFYVSTLLATYYINSDMYIFCLPSVCKLCHFSALTSFKTSNKWFLKINFSGLSRLVIKKII